MSTTATGKKVLVLHGTQDSSTTAQTPAMERRPGIDKNIAGASKIFLGLVTCHANQIGPPHTHGEAETAAYILSGRQKVWFGEDFKEWVKAGPGDFIFVPSDFPHIEGNPFDEPCEVVLSRGPDNIVINLPESDK